MLGIHRAHDLLQYQIPIPSVLSGASTKRGTMPRLCNFPFRQYAYLVCSSAIVCLLVLVPMVDPGLSQAEYPF